MKQYDIRAIKKKLTIKRPQQSLCLLFCWIYAVFMGLALLCHLYSTVLFVE
jgi:hypothetical protein